MPEGKKGKWVRVDPHLRIAVAVEAYTPAVIGHSGVVEVRPSAKRPAAREVYLNLNGKQSPKIEVNVPAGLEAPWGQIVFNDNVPGAGFNLGRDEEEMPFSPKEKGGYVPLRLYRESEHSFNPVYVRIDEGPTTRFFVVNARWEGDTITIEIERDPVHIPLCLVDA